ncbi:hypothetical protein Gpo141_00013373 [Globisporangium polare]
MDTIAGSKGVGVAPGATWIACKGCRWYDDGEGGQELGCSEEDLTVDVQLTLCLTDTNGDNPDCSKARLVWRAIRGGGGGADGRAWFKPAVDAWVKAGIVPVFSQGNSGSDCSTVGSPGDYPNVIGVGATDSTDGLADFSSKALRRLVQVYTAIQWYKATHQSVVVIGLKLLPQ